MMAPTSLTLLLILMALNCSHALIYGKPSRTPIELDLSGNISEIIQVTPSENDDGCLTYAIDEEYDEWYRIGDVIYDGELILEDHIMNDKRIVFFIPYDDLDYLEVTNVYKRDDGGIGRVMDDFIREHGSYTYHPVVRTPVELDLQSEELAPQIVFTATIEGTREYNIMDNLRLYFVIGMVRYGRYLLDNEVEDVINKRVICSQFGKELTCEVIRVMKDMTTARAPYTIEV